MLPVQLLLLAFLAFVTFIWLVVVAFKKSPLWGFLVLFLSPITAIIFGIKYWQDVKIAFLAYVLSNTVFFGFMFHSVTQMVNSSGLMEMAERAQRGEQISEEEMARKMLEATEKMAEMGFITQADLQKARQEFNSKFPPQQKPDIAPKKQTVTPPPSTSQQQKTEVAQKAKVESEPKTSTQQQTKLETSSIKPPPKNEIAAATKVESEKIETDSGASAAAEPAPEAIPDEVIDQVIEEIEKQEDKSTLLAGQKSKKAAFHSISIAEAGDYLGKKVKVIDKRGKSHIGRLEKVEANRIILQKITGLIYSYDIQTIAIKSLMVEK